MLSPVRKASNSSTATTAPAPAQTQLSEIKAMLRAMEPGLGLQLVSAEDEVTTTAWVFVGLNVLLAAYLANAFLVAPLVNSVALVSSSTL